MLKIRRSRDRLIFNMGIPVPGKDGLYIETMPWIIRILCANEQMLNGLQSNAESLWWRKYILRIMHTFQAMLYKDVGR